MRLQLLLSAAFRLDVIGGYRYYELSDSLSIQEQLVVLNAPPTATGTQINVTNNFRTRNCFNGTEIGLIADYYYCRWSLEFSAKMSMGWNHEVAFINGSTVVTTPDGSMTGNEGGLLALDTNIGSYSRDAFVVIPEFGVQLGYQFTERLRGFVGYDFLYWAQVARAGDQVNLNVNDQNLPPPLPHPANNDPTFSFNSTAFSAQGIRLPNIGSELAGGGEFPARCDDKKGRPGRCSPRPPVRFDINVRPAA